MTEKTFVISLGGAVICPKAGEINADFLKKFRSLILGFVRKRCRFVIITGGGKICRAYQKAAKDAASISDRDLDWLGIHVTRLNGYLLKTIFGKNAYSEVLCEPNGQIRDSWKILISAGWKPGRSTDYDAVLLAKRFGAEEIINASNTPYVYNKDFRKYKDAIPIKEISWKDYRKIIGRKWAPGMSAPFDPVASGAAQKSKIRTIIIEGTDVNNFKKLLSGQKFRGTVIVP